MKNKNEYVSKMKEKTVIMPPFDESFFFGQRRRKMTAKRKISSMERWHDGIVVVMKKLNLKSDGEKTNQIKIKN